MRTNVRSQPTAFTHEGAPSVQVDAVRELRRSVMSNLLFEDTFYENGQDSATRIRDLVKRVSFEDGAAIAIDARERMKLRHVPLLITRELIRNHNGRKVGDLIAQVIQRPDELGELLSLYWLGQPKDKRDPLTSQMKIGLARAMKKFDEYALAKYNRDGDVKLKDILFLTHARPRVAENTPQVTIGAINKPSYKRGEVIRHYDCLFDRLVNDRLTTPDTWEVKLSAGENKKETFTRLIQENKLGALALLRNLRGMTEAGVEKGIITGALEKMNAERVLPFRFITAAKHASQYEPQLEQALFKSCAAIPKLPGHTAVLVDHSGSMQSPISGKSEVLRADCALAMAMLVREIAEDCRVFGFSDICVEVPPRRGFALRDAINQHVRPSSTYLGKAVAHVYTQYRECDRLIVITDEQSADRPHHPQAKGYIINVAGYQNGIGYGPWITIDGWSEAVLEFIREYETNG